MMMPGAMPMMPGMAMPAGDNDRMKQVMAKKPKREDDKVTTVFVGGLRKSTSEDKVIGHFAKYGQVESVDIKRLPDGSSRGFAFVKFADKDSVHRCVEAKASHMIDNKWVAVRPHGGTAFQAAQHAERQRMAHDREKEKKETEQPATEEDYEEKWSEKYLQQAASLQSGGEDKEEEDGKDKDTPVNPMMAMMMNPMMAMMMNPMMAGMNPMMMGARPMMMPGCCGCPGAMPQSNNSSGEAEGSAGPSQGSTGPAGTPCMPCGGCMMPGCMMPGCCGCPCAGCCMGMPGMPMMPGMAGATPGAPGAGAAPPGAAAIPGGPPGDSGDAEAEGGGGPVKEGGGENRFQPY
ncbi:RNA-binding protein squid (Heterogeneous nuclear ribonucleoprotein 40) (HNRNP 40) [Durusdinium trenchii]|uniref:RNA-binding protein squid (Heterogeneous nuclear ribonucleoprotein 40) (HNRNP 40) n=1 Tax=Durusdinium trenchii TaxID=1381693 RepID=A0ABP0K415_9DINO